MLFIPDTQEQKCHNTDGTVLQDHYLWIEYIKVVG